MSTSLRIVFMGTPDFAVPSLKGIIEKGYNVVGVVTAPDKPAGRGLKVKSTPVKNFAEENNIPVLQPQSLKDPEFIKELESLNPDLQVVVAFRKLPKEVWNLPPKGTFNLHASLLPDYRGAAPINWAIINGEKETGVTTFFLNEEIDKGSIIFQDKVSIGENDTAGALHDKLSEVGASLVTKTIQAIKEGKAPAKPQPITKSPKSAPKIFKEDCKINWNLNLDELHNFIRGLSPFPTAWTYFREKQLKIYLTDKIYSSQKHPVGKVISDDKTYLHVAVKGGYLSLLEVQIEGKRKVKIEDFLNGFDIPEGFVFGQ